MIKIIIKSSHAPQKHQNPIPLPVAAAQLPGNAWGLKVHPPVRRRNGWELGTRNVNLIYHITGEIV